MRIVGRYALYAEIAAGGMATVHFGRLLGPVGFSRTVAIKRLHPQFAKDPEFVSMFLDEARLAARIRHPNVVPTLDVVATNGELFLVMEYIQGESLSRLTRAYRDRNARTPPRIVAAIMSGALHGLHAAHEARNERGEPLGIVHRDISPQNVLVGSDGVARVLDFGVAKAAGRVQTTREGQLKGKLAYMAPEQLTGVVSRQSDIYAAAVVLWETLTGKRLFTGDNEAMVLGKVLSGVQEKPSTYILDGRQAPPDGITMQGLEQLDLVTLRGLDQNPTKRYATAREMAIALEKCVGLATPSEVGEWVETTAREVLHHRAEKIAQIESTTSAVHVHGSQIVSALKTDPPRDGAAEVETMPAASPSAPKLHLASADPDSQLSSISLSKPGSGEVAVAPKRRRGVLFAVLAVLAAVCSVFAAVSVQRTAAANRQRVAATAPTTAQGSGSAEPTTTPASAAPPPTADAAEASSIVATPPPTGSVAAPTPPPTTTAPAAPTAPPKSRTPSTGHASATKAAKVDCSVPWTIDAKGHKIYKMECLK